MSKLEERIQESLSKNRIRFEIQKAIPIEDYPWKTNLSKTPPKCDIFLNNYDIYIEIKGFMTYNAVSKLSYLSRQSFKYYIFQGTEPEWNPFIDTFISTEEIKKSKKLESNIKHQVDELINLKTDSDFYRNISSISLSRLKNYISIKINEYKSWNGEWY
jgi:hypothetical protein